MSRNGPWGVPRAVRFPHGWRGLSGGIHVVKGCFHLFSPRGVGMGQSFVPHHMFCEFYVCRFPHVERGLTISNRFSEEIYLSLPHVKRGLSDHPRPIGFDWIVFPT